MFYYIWTCTLHINITYNLINVNFLILVVSNKINTENFECREYKYNEIKFQCVFKIYTYNKVNILVFSMNVVEFNWYDIKKYQNTTCSKVYKSTVTAVTKKTVKIDKVFQIFSFYQYRRMLF